ncbi:hypothetical protein A1O3_04667 [Capronia epimyces CBS 606.96]|uniref:PH-response regulator protein palH/RIM21 n=1 Tax=Capronia epimyces CBS 606.96 TaxID=1182542 RepID=W9Y2Y9_9EURO|nr:uncharacterized protein A1O3_04667 [Capronia epimyces CBS 606.96]EXJ84000.1 hypothetical protein A1O3_04667 [Capronia epimyces CBS 606.96]
MSHGVQVTARQLWGHLSTPAVSQTASSAWCTPLILPSGGIFVFDNDQTSTLQAKVTFMLPCENPDPIISPDTTGNSSVIGFQDPFYASISPQIFALATATVISYVLVILIFITPRTFFVGGPGGGARLLGRRGVITGTYGSSSIVGVGRRPLLQKIATVTVAVSLTIATADTFSVAENQYNEGYMDSNQLVDNVVRSLEIRIIRVISDTFLWLAQVQTLIRLFPRHKEKVTIKWLGFAMVSSDTIFSILDSFVSDNARTRPRSFSDAIPALNYLFELAISLIYASCVVYYCLSKRRFAFWHPKMKNICLVALLSLISVVIPVVFFVLDISQPDLAGWGEYIRWVGAAAASVVVWEWVERIESLERDERKDGILGREVFDGDEMLNMTSSDDASWHGHGRSTGQEGGLRKTIGDGMLSRYNRLRVRLPLRKRRKTAPPDGINTGADALNPTGQRSAPHNQLVIQEERMPPPSRTGTGSTGSTVYAIRYHNPTSPSPNFLQNMHSRPASDAAIDAAVDASSEHSALDSLPSTADKEMVLEPVILAPSETFNRQRWHSVTSPFKRRRAEPPAEVADAQIASGIRRSPIDRSLNLRGRLGAFASAQKERFAHRGSLPAVSLPVTVIPAPKGDERTWSPDDLCDGPTIDAAIPTDSRNTSSASQGTGDGQGGPDGPASVVNIPAPIQGRTWSPDSLLNSATSHSRQHGDGNVQHPDSVATPPTALVSRTASGSHDGTTAAECFTTSATGTSSSQAGDIAHSITPRPTAYKPSSNIAPIAEHSTEEDTGELVQDHDPLRENRTTPRPLSPHRIADPETNTIPNMAAGADAEANISALQPSPAVVVAGNSTGDNQLGQVEQDSDVSEDGRDTGGT